MKEFYVFTPANVAANPFVCILRWLRLCHMTYRKWPPGPQCVKIFCHRAGRRQPFTSWAFLPTGPSRQPELVKSQRHVELKWFLRLQDKDAGQSSCTGQVVACQCLKNMSQGLFSWCGVFWGIPCSGADVYREQRNKATENRCTIVRCAAGKSWGEPWLSGHTLRDEGKTRYDRPLSTVLVCHFPKNQIS